MFNVKERVVFYLSLFFFSISLYAFCSLYFSFCLTFSVFFSLISLSVSLFFLESFSLSLSLYPSFCPSLSILRGVQSDLNCIKRFDNWCQRIFPPSFSFSNSSCDFCSLCFSLCLSKNKKMFNFKEKIGFYLKIDSFLFLSLSTSLLSLFLSLFYDEFKASWTTLESIKGQVKEIF